MLHVCLVGSDGVGQGELLHHIREGELPNPLKGEPGRQSYLTTTVIDGEEFRVRLTDTRGEEQTSMRPGVAQTAHCILCCFSVIKRDTLEKVENVWIPTIKPPKPPIILLGLQIDERENRPEAISNYEGYKTAKRVGAVGYLEARTEDSQGVLSAAVRTAKKHLANLYYDRCVGKVLSKDVEPMPDEESSWGKPFDNEFLPFDDDTHQLETDMVKKNLSALGTTPAETHAYLRCDLVDFKLTSLGALRGFPHLQYVNLSKNRLRSLEPLGKLPFLLHIDASYNLLERTQTFGPPRQLETVDLSFNFIEDVGDWAVHRYLREVNLRGNLIQVIPAGSISSNKTLRMLDLSENHLWKIENIPLGVEALFLSDNHLTSLEGVEVMSRLQVLNAKKNFIQSLAPVRSANLPRLRKLCVSENNIGSIHEIQHLHEFEFLCDLFLSPNPVDQLPHYRAQVLYRVPDLRYLDDSRAAPEEKIKARVLYGEYVDATKEIFSQLVPNEDWLDRRLVTHTKMEAEEMEKFGQRHMVSSEYQTIEEVQGPTPISSSRGFGIPA